MPPNPGSMLRKALGCAGEGAMILAVFLLPVFQYLDANPYFKFKYGFDSGMFYRVLLLFGILPLAIHTIALRLPKVRLRARQILLWVVFLCFLSQLYSTTLYAHPWWLAWGVVAGLAAAAGYILGTRWREFLPFVAGAALLTVPYVAYQTARHWWHIPRPPSVGPLPLTSPVDNDIYVFFLDGCTVTSDNLDAAKLPDATLFPNFHRLATQSHWFYNAVSNGPETSNSAAPMFTGRLHVTRRNNYLANAANVFSILAHHYDVRVYLHTKSFACVGDDYALCYPFQSASYGQPLRVLAESLAFLCTFRLSPLSYEIGAFTRSSYSRDDFVNDFLDQLGVESERPRFFAIQLFDRGVERMQEFDVFLGNCLATLKEQDRLERSIIMIVADHGYVMVDGKMVYGNNAKQTPALYRVPFLIKTAAGGPGKTYAYEAQGIDIAPTLLAAALGPQVLQSPPILALQFDGVDLLHHRPERQHYFNLFKGGLYRFSGDGPEPVLVEVAVDEALPGN